MAEYTEYKPEIIIPVSSNLLHDAKFQELPLTARYVLICLMDAAKGSRTFEAPSPKEYGIHHDTMKSALNRLIQAGFLKTAATAEERESVTA